MKEMYDVFISHASEDKEELVLPLVQLLTALGLSVWYDDFALMVGDSLSRSIDRGLIRSRFGIVVLSPAFLRKNWPEYELRGLTSREMAGQNVILPIWHNITKASLLEYSPSLADKRALDTTRQALPEIGLDLLRVIRPDLFDHLQRTLEWRRQIAQATPVLTPISQIKPSPIRHKTLPRAVLLRIKLVHLVLGEVGTLSLDRFINNFRRDLHVEEELQIWENIAAAYLESTLRKVLSVAEKKQIFTDLLGISFGSSKPGDHVHENDGQAALARIYDSVIPAVPADED